MLFKGYNIHTGYVLRDDVESWIYENCGEWSFGKLEKKNVMTFTFGEDTDAMAFKLRWL